MNGGSSAPYLACTPCVPLFVYCLIRVEAEGLLDYQGRAGIISIVRWNLRPVIFGVENSFSLRISEHKSLQFPNAVALNAFGCRNTQKSAKERPPRKICKQPGLKRPDSLCESLGHLSPLALLFGELQTGLELSDPSPLRWLQQTNPHKSWGQCLGAVSTQASGQVRLSRFPILEFRASSDCLRGAKELGKLRGGETLSKTPPQKRFLNPPACVGSLRLQKLTFKVISAIIDFRKSIIVIRAIRAIQVVPILARKRK